MTTDYYPPPESMGGWRWLKTSEEVRALGWSWVYFFSVLSSYSAMVPCAPVVEWSTTAQEILECWMLEIVVET